MIDSSGVCNFIVITIPDENKLINLLEKATGLSFGGREGLLKAGERVFNLEKLFNLEAGLTAKDDTLPKRFYKEPMPDGPGKGHVIHTDEMLSEYYELRGWNAKGVPTSEKLKELGIQA